MAVIDTTRHQPYIVPTCSYSSHAPPSWKYSAMVAITIQRRVYSLYESEKLFSLLEHGTNLYVFRISGAFVQKLNTAWRDKHFMLVKDEASCTFDGVGNTELHKLMIAAHNTAELASLPTKLLKDLTLIGRPQMLRPFNVHESRAMLWASIVLAPRDSPDKWVNQPYDKIVRLWTSSDSEVEDADDVDDDMLDTVCVSAAAFKPSLVASSMHMMTPVFGLGATTIETAEPCTPIVYDTPVHQNAYNGFSQMQHLAVQKATLASSMGTFAHVIFSYELNDCYGVTTDPKIRQAVSSIVPPLCHSLGAAARQSLELITGESATFMGGEVVGILLFLTQGQHCFGAFPDAVVDRHDDNVVVVAELKTRWAKTWVEIENRANDEDTAVLRKNKMQTAVQAMAIGMLFNKPAQGHLIVQHVPNMLKVIEMRTDSYNLPALANVQSIYCDLLLKAVYMHQKNKPAKQYASHYTDDHLHIPIKSAAIWPLMRGLLPDADDGPLYTLVTRTGVIRISPFLTDRSPVTEVAFEADDFNLSKEKDAEYNVLLEWPLVIKDHKFWLRSVEKKRRVCTFKYVYASTLALKATQAFKDAITHLFTTVHVSEITFAMGELLISVGMLGPQGIVETFEADEFVFVPLPEGGAMEYIVARASAKKLAAEATAVVNTKADTLPLVIPTSRECYTAHLYWLQGLVGEPTLTVAPGDFWVAYPDTLRPVAATSITMPEIQKYQLEHEHKFLENPSAHGDWKEAIARRHLATLNDLLEYEKTANPDPDTPRGEWSEDALIKELWRRGIVDGFGRRTTADELWDLLQRAGMVVPPV